MASDFLGTLVSTSVLVIVPEIAQRSKNKTIVLTINLAKFFRPKTDLKIVLFSGNFDSPVLRASITGIGGGGIQ